MGGHEELARSVIAVDADLNAEARGGDTPLLAAALRDDTLVRTLLRKGVAMAVINKERKTDRVQNGDKGGNMGSVEAPLQAGATPTFVMTSAAAPSLGHFTLLVRR